MRADVGAEGNDVPRRESPASDPALDGRPTRRSNLARQETDSILSYYLNQSSDAGRDVSTSPSQHNGLGHSDWSRPSSVSGPEPSTRTFSTKSASTSSSPTSDYTEYTRTNSRPLQPRAASPPASSSTSGALRRTSVPSQGGTDRRRLAIMQMDTSRPLAQDRAEQSAERRVRSSDSEGVPPSNYHPQRGHDLRLGGLALVAPPDASPQSYTAWTPPKAAPVSKLQPSISAGPPVSSHSRSASDVTRALSKGKGHVPRKSSREVAVVGTASFPGVASVSQQHLKASPTTESLKPPLFQIPQSRSPSPGASEVSDFCSTNPGRQRKDALSPGVSPITEVKEAPTPVRTPNIGESKRISDRVAGPVVINLFPESPSPSSAYSSPSSSTQDTMSPRTNVSSPLTPSTALTSPAMSPSPFLFYQPGLHATAGPLPPPPQAVFNIDPKTPPPPRPPRHSPIRKKGELEAMKEALQLPPHVVAALKAKPSAPSMGKKAFSSTVSPSPQQSPTTVPATITSPKERHLSLSSRESTSSDTKPHHVREGAFPPSRLGTVDSETMTSSSEAVITTLPPLDSMDDLVASIGLAIDDMGIMSSSDVPPPTVVEPPRTNEGQSHDKGLEIRHNNNRRLSFSPNTSPERPPAAPVGSPRSEGSREWVDPDKTITFSEEKVPPVPAKNDIPHLDTKSLKGVLNIKRFSALPRTPSLMSLNRLSAGSKRSSRTPSPSVAHSIQRPKPPVRRTKSVNPPAMYFADITVKRTSLERSIGYAYKINELYNYDCGLGDWIAETRYKALHPRSSTKRPSVNPSGGPRAPSTSSPSIAPRHFSQSSTDSGVTFPRRADAYSATDLSARTAGDASPPNAPPPLPYPALAAAPRNGPSRASTMIATSSSSSSRSVASPSSSAKSPSGFFASLGRKTSLKENSLSPPSPAKKLSKSPPRNVNELSSPRLANLPPVAPTVPGGPRAPPNRMQRSQTIIITSQNSMNGGVPQRSSTMARRPSLYDGRGGVHQQAFNGTPDAEFTRQIDKLAALLPKADKKVLAIYLRRAGQDILAIGQYLEDEKNGALRYE